MLSVRIQPPEVERGSREADWAALSVALIELGLADLPGVVPRVGDTPLAPGLRSSMEADEHWTLTLSQPDTRSLRGELCRGTDCTEFEEKGPDEQPTAAVAELLVGVSIALGRTAPQGVMASWTRPGTRDRYARQIAGRAASVVYGMRDPPEEPGDKRSDPVARAFFLDPGMPVAAWMASRAYPEPVVLGAQARAAAARPESTLLAAELAGSLSPARVAFPVYDELLLRASFDRRYLVAIAANRFAVGRANEATQILDALGEGAGLHPSVAQLRVAIATGTGQGDLEELLQRWRKADPQDPEPVRRLIRARVTDGRYQSALELLEDLVARGGGIEAEQLELALRHALGDEQGASRVALALGEPQLAADLLLGKPGPPVRSRPLLRLK